MKSVSKVLLNPEQTAQRINRLAYQIYEDNVEEKEIYLAGILNNGWLLAEKLAVVLEQIAAFKVRLIKISVEKHGAVPKHIPLSVNSGELGGKSLVLVDDVLNSGRTMVYALKPCLDSDIKKIRTVVLVNRNHTRYPVKTDFAGLSLATTLQNHVIVEFREGKVYARLE